MPTVFCTQCGRENPEDARFCAHCGNTLTKPGQPVGGGDATSTISISAVEAWEPSTTDEADLALHAEAVQALPPGAALLVVRRGPNAGSRFLLDREVTTVGRHPESDIFLDDVTVSRRHAEFHRTENGFVVRDVGSLNGTYVNRERIDEAALSSGDEVQIGKFRLVYLTAATRAHPGE
ncbi:FHA domain containing protein [Acidothermus cellulolyticus 11B]|uniref:FHA domain containing protein n=1 Tax=Acidothermus cellulolyticus (strain ATCC 43068 / DSM 8971 / 11B) TaxID=351607 RepID=A0LU88_ACIC1|nr:FHA domain-containing protein [Acidothermus cellulolyticus]ABK52998.1 FHA domain containing protein [Acidothermus cellulolyticus 11B]